MDVKEYAINSLLGVEGGLSNDPDDPGRLTNFGISSRSYPALDIANLTREEAVAIYERDFWDKMKLDKLPPELAVILLHFGVVGGPETGVILLQRALGVKADGIVGKHTIQAASDAMQKYPLDTIARVVEIQITYLRSLVQSKPVKNKFWAGWMSRIVKSVIASARVDTLEA